MKHAAHDTTCHIPDEIPLHLPTACPCFVPFRYWELVVIDLTPPILLLILPTHQKQCELTVHFDQVFLSSHKIISWTQLNILEQKPPIVPLHATLVLVAPWTLLISAYYWHGLHLRCHHRPFNPLYRTERLFQLLGLPSVPMLMLPWSSPDLPRVGL